MDKKTIEKLIELKLTAKEKLFYRDYIKYMNEKNFYEFVYYLKNKNRFFALKI
jgi:hypothetical protein